MSFIDRWDAGEPGATWDSGIQWDVNVGPNLGDISPYLALITSEHRDKPKFIAMLTATLQPVADIQALIASMPGLFDLDVAVGDQLDKVGQWIGASRILNVPLTGIYFALDAAGVGLDQGSLKGPFDPTSGLVALPDDAYRLLLRAKLLNDRWDGTIPAAYAIWAALFIGTDHGILIQDTGQMHMIVALTGSTPDTLTLALFLGGYLNVRPAGVAIDYYMTPGTPDTPYFGLDAETDAVSGLDVGSFGLLNNGTGY